MAARSLEWPTTRLPTYNRHNISTPTLVTAHTLPPPPKPDTPNTHPDTPRRHIDCTTQSSSSVSFAVPCMRLRDPCHQAALERDDTNILVAALRLRRRAPLFNPPLRLLSRRSFFYGSACLHPSGASTRRGSLMPHHHVDEHHESRATSNGVARTGCSTTLCIPSRGSPFRRSSICCGIGRRASHERQS